MSADVDRATTEAAGPDLNGVPTAPLDAPSTLDLNLTDLGNAERLVARHGHDLRFCHPWGRWLVWDDHRWRIDEEGRVTRLATDTVKALYAEALDVREDERDLRKRLIKHALDSEREPRVRAMVTLAESRPGIPVRPDELDADPWLLNVANGTLELPEGTLREHRRDDLLTKIAPVAHDARAKCPRWLAFLEHVLGGDRDLIAFVRNALGYSLTGDTGEQVLFLLHGSGANGKTTFLETVRALLGDYSLQTPADTLLVRRYSGVPNDLARLRGARFVAAVETPEGSRLNEPLVKQLVGGDTLTARFMRAEWFEFHPELKLWLATNHKPSVRGTDEAIWRRIRLVPFTVTIPANERDPALADKLRAELPGILTWVLEGCQDWRWGDGLGAPEAVVAATSAYRDEMDVLGEFIADRCIVDPTARAKVGDLYRAYGEWCDAAGERDRLSQKAFGLRLKERGFDDARTNTGRWRIGIGLLSDDLFSGSEHDA